MVKLFRDRFRLFFTVFPWSPLPLVFQPMMRNHNHPKANEKGHWRSARVKQIRCNRLVHLAQIFNSHAYRYDLRPNASIGLAHRPRVNCPNRDIHAAICCWIGRWWRR